MLRKVVKHKGDWTPLELSEDEVTAAFEKVREFNIRAFKAAVEDAEKISKRDDVQFPVGHDDIIKALFDKYAMQSFSVLKNHADAIMG